METKMKNLIKIPFLMILAAVLFAACSNEDNGTNPNTSAPKINSLSASPDSVQRGETSAITCDAVDPNGNALTYFWAATGGSINGSGSSITWTAPDTEGMFSISCNVENSQGSRTSAKVDVRVVKPNVPEQGLVAWYPFNNNANDAGNNNYNGSLMSGATANGFLTIGPNATDALSLPNQVLNGLNDFTISGWLRMGRTGDAFEPFWVSCSNGSNHNFLYILYSNSRNRWEIAIDGAVYSFPTNIQMKDLKWHHVTVIRSGALARLYIDGSEIGTGISVKTLTLNVANNGLIIGQDQDALGGAFQAFQAWAGDMDNLRFYNRALSAAEIQQLANEGHSGS